MLDIPGAGLHHLYTMIYPRAVPLYIFIAAKGKSQEKAEMKKPILCSRRRVRSEFTPCTNDAAAGSDIFLNALTCIVLLAHLAWIYNLENSVLLWREKTSLFHLNIMSRDGVGACAG